MDQRLFLLLIAINTLVYSRPAENEEVSENRRFEVDFGNGNQQVDLDSLESRKAVQEAVENILKATKTVETGTQVFLQFSVAEKFKFLKGLNGIATILSYGLDLIFPDDSIKRLHEAIKNLVLQEFAKITRLMEAQFKTLLFRIDFKDYRENVADKIAFGLSKMRRMLVTGLTQNRAEFKQWCSDYSPIDLAERMLDRFTGEGSVIKSFIEVTEYNHQIYTHFESGLAGHLKALELLVANCEAVQPISRNNKILEDFAKTGANIVAQVERERLQLAKYWPDKVQQLAQAEIDKGGSNIEKANRIYEEIEKRFNGRYFVGVYNGEAHGFGDHTLYSSSESTFFEWRYKNTNYVIFRSRFYWKAVNLNLDEKFEEYEDGAKARAERLWNSGQRGPAGQCKMILVVTKRVNKRCTGLSYGSKVCYDDPSDFASRYSRDAAYAWSDDRFDYVVGLN